MAGSTLEFPTIFWALCIIMGLFILYRAIKYNNKKQKEDEDL